MSEADLIIIGAGPGGYETAVRAAAAGLKTVVVEAYKVGGTCLNEGCIPTKCLCRNADFLRDLHKAGRLGVDNLSFSFHIENAIKRKEEVIATLSQGVATLLKHPLITLVHGRAEFADPHTVHVETDSEETGERDFHAANVIIATGSVTKFLPIEGKDLPGVLTSTEMLDLTEVPQSLCIIGGGVIGLEFASIFKAFGSEVTVVEFCREILPNFDSDICKRLKQDLKSQGIRIINQAAVNGIEQNGKSYTVNYMLKDVQEKVNADIVLMAVGRAPNTSSLNLADAGILFDKKGIATDDNLQTNVPGVYAIGDVNGKCQLAHAATFQGRRALNHILNEKDDIRLDIVPAAVFTHPEVASVGLTADACKQQGLSVKAHKAFFRANGKAMAMDETEGMAKILTDDAGKIVGCHLYGPHAADLIEEVAVLMNRDATVEDLSQIIHPHPTLSEVLLTAAEN